MRHNNRGYIGRFIKFLLLLTTKQPGEHDNSGILYGVQHGVCHLMYVVGLVDMRSSSHDHLPLSLFHSSLLAPMLSPWSRSQAMHPKRPSGRINGRKGRQTSSAHTTQLAGLWFVLASMNQIRSLGSLRTLPAFLVHYNTTHTQDTPVIPSFQTKTSVRAGEDLMEDSWKRRFRNANN